MAEKELAKLNVTYSIGDRFRTTGGGKVIMSKVDSSHVALISLANGKRWSSNYEYTVKDESLITQKELCHISLGCRITRYWDNRTKEKV